jgi:hypothetical protein
VDAPTPDAEHAAALSLLAKLRAFIEGELTETERMMLASLLGPGVVAAYAVDEVAGFDGGWGASALPDGLVQALSDEDVRVEGLGL